MTFKPITVESITNGFDKGHENITPFTMTEIVIKATGVTRFIAKDLTEFLIGEEKRFEKNRLMYLAIHISILVLILNTLKKNGTSEPSVEYSIKESWEELLEILEKYD